MTFTSLGSNLGASHPHINQPSPAESKARGRYSRMANARGSLSLLVVLPGFGWAVAGNSAEILCVRTNVH